MIDQDDLLIKIGPEVTIGQIKTTASKVGLEEFAGGICVMPVDAPPPYWTAQRALIICEYTKIEYSPTVLVSNVIF